MDEKVQGYVEDSPYKTYNSTIVNGALFYENWRPDYIFGVREQLA